MLLCYRKTISAHMHIHACVARSARLETYVNRELEDKINDAAEQRDQTVSAFLREAARDKLQNMEAFDE